jgi:hypothetical protein
MASGQLSRLLQKGPRTLFYLWPSVVENVRVVGALKCSAAGAISPSKERDLIKIFTRKIRL